MLFLRYMESNGCTRMNPVKREVLVTQLRECEGIVIRCATFFFLETRFYSPACNSSGLRNADFALAGSRLMIGTTLPSSISKPLVLGCIASTKRSQKCIREWPLQRVFRIPLNQISRYGALGELLRARCQCTYWTYHRSLLFLGLGPFYRFD